MRRFSFRRFSSRRAVRLVLASALAVAALLLPLAARRNSSLSLKAEGGDREVRLSWTDAGRTSETTYALFRGTARGKQNQSLYQRRLRGTTFMDTNVVNDTTYFYYVQQGGEIDSNEAEATPRAKKRGGNDTAAVLGGAVIVGGIIAALSHHGHSDPLKDLTQNGPRVPDEFSMSEFSVAGPVKGGWPVHLTYRLDRPARVTLTVTADKTEPFTQRLDGAQTGRREADFRLPGRFGDKTKPGVLTVRAEEAVTTDSGGASGEVRPAPLLVLEMGCGNHRTEGLGRRDLPALRPAAFVPSLLRARPILQAGGMVENVRFDPGSIRVGARQTAAYAFLPAANFDHLKVEFRRQVLQPRVLISKVVKTDDIGGARRGRAVNAPHPWDGRTGKRHDISFGAHILQVRAWDGPDTGSDWIVGWSEEPLVVEN